MIDFAKEDFGEEEKDAVNRVLERGWLASGNENTEFEKEFAKYVGTQHAVCVNSGSSANLLALGSLRLPKGSKVLTSACGFPATLAPILHLGLEPVFVDYDLETHNISVEQVIRMLPQVDAVILAHTMGSPVEIDYICKVAKTFDVAVIEDCCEAVGSTLHGHSVGSFGDLGTFSFYPSHQMTAGGMGGMIVTNDADLANRCKEFRDWGKTWNWDEKLGDNKTMYDIKLGGLQYYRHYVYNQVGFNCKLAEMNAAFGREQLKKLPRFVEKRAINYLNMQERLYDLDDFLKIGVCGDPSWFGYILTIKDGSPLKRNEFGDYLESKGIRHRPFFAGNILKHPPFIHLLGQQQFPVADKLMRDSLFIGCHTKMGRTETDYIVEAIHEYIRLHSKL